MIRRTTVIVLFAFEFLTWSISAIAQQPTKVPLVGVLSDESRSRAESFEPFVQGMRELGWVEGQSIAFERRYAGVAIRSAMALFRLSPDRVEILLG